METKARSHVSIPADRPLRARAEGGSATRSASGTPTACIEPFEIELPRLTVDLGRIVVRLPRVRISACVRLPQGGEAAAPSADEVRRLIADAPWTPTETEVVPPTATVTPVRVHAIPRSASVRPICVQADFDSVAITTASEPLESRLHGCVVANGPPAECAGKAKVT